MADHIDFKFGTLFSKGFKGITGDKWDAELDETVRNSQCNAALTISLKIFFQQIDPAGETGLHDDANTGKKDKKTGKLFPQRRIQKWKGTEFATFTAQVVKTGTQFWDNVFCLMTPASYHGLDWPDGSPKYRCNIDCRLQITSVLRESDAHYTIACVRIPDDEKFRSHTRLYNSRDIQPRQYVKNSTVKFWTHYHEIGHLIGLGHIGWNSKHHNLIRSNYKRAYGVKKSDKQDVMGLGSEIHPWHAQPWLQAAEGFTRVKAHHWHVTIAHPVLPIPLPHKF